MDRAQLVQLLQQMLSTLPDSFVCVYLFGSWARDQARPDSDVDLAFFRRERSLPRLSAQPYAVAAELEAKLGRPVDLIELNRASPDLLHQVLRDGRVVLDRDPEFRVQAEIRARADYLDMLPTLRRYRAARSP